MFDCPSTHEYSYDNDLNYERLVIFIYLFFLYFQFLISVCSVVAFRVNRFFYDFKTPTIRVICILLKIYFTLHIVLNQVSNYRRTIRIFHLDCHKFYLFSFLSKKGLYHRSCLINLNFYHPDNLRLISLVNRIST